MNAIQYGEILRDRIIKAKAELAQLEREWRNRPLTGDVSEEEVEPCCSVE